MTHEPPTDAAPPDAALVYGPSPAGLDTGSYDLTDRRAFTDDPVTHASLDDLPRLAGSENWEDRIRAELLRQRATITLPDQFPCIYETPDSPSRGAAKYPRPHPWVVSPDLDMLTTLLPDYQELWDSYTSQWGPSSRRTFAVGRLDGLKTHRVYRPGATPADVIGATMLTHSDMYRRAPQHLRRMHPQHQQWQAARQAARQVS